MLDKRRSVRNRITRECRWPGVAGVGTKADWSIGDKLTPIWLAFSGPSPESGLLGKTGKTHTPECVSSGVKRRLSQMHPAVVSRTQICDAERSKLQQTDQCLFSKSERGLERPISSLSNRWHRAFSLVVRLQ